MGKILEKNQNFLLRQELKVVSDSLHVCLSVRRKFV